MKPSSIPFMPEFVLATDKRKMYWISHEELLYTIESWTEGAPYTDHFSTVISHHITKVEGGVKVEIKMFINWIKSTIMKGKI